MYDNGLVKQFTPGQHELVSLLATRLGEIRGVKAVVLGGSYARGRAHSGSDIDIGILYSEMNRFSVDRVRELVESLNDTPAFVITGFYEWGPWVNGGAWLTIGGQRVDFLYRCLEHVERVIGEAEAGRYELDYAQQPPFGFFSPTYLGEIALCVPLFDPEGLLHSLKQRVERCPEALRRSVVQDFLWAAEFGLVAFAQKFAARGDVYGTAACLTRAVNQLILALFALNRRYLINDKTALEEIAEFESVPPEFGMRVRRVFAKFGDSKEHLAASVTTVQRLLRECIALAGELYHPRFSLPK